jgi:hypothetical protein
MKRIDPTRACYCGRAKQNDHTCGRWKCEAQHARIHDLPEPTDIRLQARERAEEVSHGEA